MRTLRVLAWLVLPLLLLLVGAIAYLPFYVQDHKADLEAAAGEALGRPVAIDGVTLGWLLHPRPALSIVLKGLRVSNQDWATDRTLGPHLLETERVDLTLELRALLRRQVRIDQLVIRGARLMLQTTADGRDNWQLGATNGEAAGNISLRVPTVQVFDSEVAFAAAKGLVRRADVTRLQLDALGAQPLVLQAELLINQTPLTLSASVSVDSDWSVRLAGKLGDRLGTLQLTPVAMPKGGAPAPSAQTTALW